MGSKKSLGERVQQFSTLSLPGQPMSTHMGTSSLVNDLWRRVQELEAENRWLWDSTDEQRRNAYHDGCINRQLDGEDDDVG